MTESVLGVLLILLCTLATIVLPIEALATANSSSINSTVIAQTPLIQQHETQTQPAILTHTGGLNSYTFSYPSNWQVVEKPPITKFDSHKTEITTNNNNRITLDLSPSSFTNIENFKSTMNSASQLVPNAIPNALVDGSGFGYYSLGGYDTHGMLISVPSEIPGITKKVLSLLTYINGWDLQLTYAATNPSFETEIPQIEALINSFRVNA